jgi:hypothetical protein
MPEAIMRGIVSRSVLLSSWLAASMVAQTQIDLRTQSKSVDFQTAQYTKPLKSGSSLPATCTQGELFFLTTAAAGSNVYGCVAVNTWAAQGSGGGSGGGSGALTVQSNGSVVGTRSIANFVSGAGIINVISDTGTVVNVQQAVDTAVVLTRAGHQSGQTLLCASSGGSGSAYTCRMSPTLSSYQSGMLLNWTPDVNGVGGSTTLNIDLLGARAVKLADGATDPASGDLIGGRMYTIWFDGSNFRLIVPPTVSGSAGTPPTCSAATRGRVWTTFGAAGTKDQVAVCAKDSADAYAWRVLY